MNKKKLNLLFALMIQLIVLVIMPIETIMYYMFTCDACFYITFTVQMALIIGIVLAFVLGLKKASKKTVSVNALLNSQSSIIASLVGLIVIVAFSMYMISPMFLMENNGELGSYLETNGLEVILDNSTFQYYMTWSHNWETVLMLSLLIMAMALYVKDLIETFKFTLELQDKDTSSLISLYDRELSNISKLIDEVGTVDDKYKQVKLRLFTWLASEETYLAHLKADMEQGCITEDNMRETVANRVKYIRALSKNVSNMLSSIEKQKKKKQLKEK